jgi:hypothetical protein
VLINVPIGDSRLSHMHMQTKGQAAGSGKSVYVCPCLRYRDRNGDPARLYRALLQHDPGLDDVLFRERVLLPLTLVHVRQLVEHARLCLQ